MISSFKGDNEYLSNFYVAPVTFDGVVYPSSEHAYQAVKFLEPEARAAVIAAPTPGAAKRLGRKFNLRPDWEEVKVLLMYQIVKCKFEQHEHLAAKLLATGDAHLVEGNWWGDKFWGVCGGEGQNFLGRILMRIREELRNK